MTFNYVLTAADFLEYYLYMVSKSAAISRKRNIAKYSFSVVYTVFGLYFLYSEMLGMGILFMTLANLWFFFYPKLNRKSLERYYAKYTQENFGHQMNRSTRMEFLTDSVFITDGEIENNVAVSQIEKTIETPNHFFLREKSGNTFIIPKNQVDATQFVSQINNLTVFIENQTNWKWK